MKGAKYDSEGEEIQKIAENGLFWPFFLGGQVWGEEPPTGEAFAPPPMPPLGGTQ